MNEDKEAAWPGSSLFLPDSGKTLNFQFETFNFSIQYRFSISQPNEPVIISEVVVEILNQLFYPRF
ncbi:hypothetical protein [Bacteroides eggerthii]|uniref:hypothetical protein n=1 Tax=Bacteroides eggerthii TaxID=28111 RepID=UPI001B8B4FCF|nr:hypothetical protein [Bacteroides eggerthii]